MNIKFRGAVIIPFPNKTARWAYGSLVTLKGETYIVPDDAEVDETGEILDGLVEVHPESVGQWTGNNEEGMDTEKEIYSNDFVTLHQFLFDGEEVESTIFGVIEYDPGRFAFSLNRIKNAFYEDYTGYSPSEGSCPINCFYGLHEGSWKVVGNTTDNPELSKGETQ